MKKVTEKFGLDYKIFAFPFTDYNLSSRFFREIEKDYPLDFTFGSAGIKNDSIENNLQRIPMDEYYLKAGKRIKIDYFYYLIKSGFKRNRIIRK